MQFRASNPSNHSFVINFSKPLPPRVGSKYPKGSTLRKRYDSCRTIREAISICSTDMEIASHALGCDSTDGWFLEMPEW